METRGRKIEELLGQEWLLTNERGSFAASTITGCPTSGYHGLLIASPDPLVHRIMALSNCLEMVQAEGQTIQLSTFEFPGRFAPEGYAHLHEFRRDTGAHFVFRAGPVDLCKSVYLARARDTVIVEYVFDAVRAPFDLILRPFVALRDFHTLQRSNAPLACRTADQGVVVCHGSLEACELSLHGTGLEFHHDPQWWFNFVYRANEGRGLPHTEDLWAPGFFFAHLERPGRVVFEAELGGPGIADYGLRIADSRCSADGTPNATHRVWEPNLQWDADDRGRTPDLAVEAVKADLFAHQEQVLARGGARDKTHRILCLAADQFVVRRTGHGDARTTIVAGYPWFADWGRDTFLSLPGLLLATGRHEEAGSVLRTFAAALDQGMIPNRFDDRTGAAEFNSVDASLWFIHAAFEYLAAAENQASEKARTADARSVLSPSSGCGPDARDTFSQQLLPAIRGIIEAYQTGTRFGIRADADGLITAGDADTQLTWMDAKCDGIAFTPRYGKAVEINALWHNALLRLRKYCEKQQLPDAGRYAVMAAQVGRSFCKLFWNAGLGYLNDVVRPDGTVDASLRPNQTFAVSLPFGPPLPREQQMAVVRAVEQNLLTPYGPRTLSSRDPAYQGRYEGSPRCRDEAYHQGTVWPYLMGPFLEAYLKVHDYSEQSKDAAAHLLRPLLRHLTENGCLGSLAEVFDGAPPHRPGGCWAQAWSVAEVLRIYRLVAAERRLHEDAAARSFFLTGGGA